MQQPVLAYVHRLIAASHGETSQRQETSFSSLRRGVPWS